MNINWQRLRILFRTGATGPMVRDGDAVWFARTRLGFEPDAVQSRLLGSAGNRVILNCSRQWGKSTVTAVRAVWQAAHAAGSLTLVMSPSLRQSGEFLKKASRFVRRLGIEARGDGVNAQSILMPNGSRIVAVPARDATVRGYSAVSLLVIDEAARVPDEMYDAVRPMLAVSGGAIWMMSTPYGKRGFFYETWANGGAEWERVMAPANECSRIRPEFLEEEMRRGKERFRQEYLCEFVTGDAFLFDRDELEGVMAGDVESLAL